MAGRPEIYTEEIATEICNRLMLGESLNKICSDDNIPARSTIYLWILNNKEGFSDKYTQAKHIQIDVLIDEILDWCDKAIEDPRLTNAIRLKADTLKWVATKLVPRKYGEKSHIEHTTINDEGESIGITFE